MDEERICGYDDCDKPVPKGRYCGMCRMRRKRASMTPEELEADKARARAYAREWYSDPANKARQRARQAAEKAAAPEAFRARANEYARQWRERNPEKRRAAWIKCKYKLTDEQYAILLAHHGTCDSCGAEKASHIDHDHESGAYRGYLCASCNWAAGHLKDQPERADAMAAYLRRTRQTASPARRVRGVPT